MRLNEIESITYDKKGVRMDRSYKGDVKVLGEIGGFIVGFDVSEHMLLLTTKSGLKQRIIRPISTLKLDHIKTHHWITNHVKVKPSQQGKGIGILLYTFALKELGLTLYSGDEQSAGGKYIWKILWMMSDENTKEPFEYKMKGLVVKAVHGYSNETEYPVILNPKGVLEIDVGQESEDGVKIYTDDDEDYEISVDEYDETLELLDRQLEAGIINDEEYEAEVKELDARNNEAGRQNEQAYDDNWILKAYYTKAKKVVDLKAF